jgi:chitobiase/beta-hexosaminidase-like protein
MICQLIWTNARWTKVRQSASRLCIACTGLTLLHLLPIVPLLAVRGKARESKPNTSFGVAWRVIGSWHIGGRNDLISDGGAIAPGSLLESLEGAGDHSITVLLPDGQRVLYECFTHRDCERGFRVPLLYRTPTSTSLDLLARVQAASRSTDQRARNELKDSSIARDEAVALIGSKSRVEVGGLAAALSDGTYSYVVRSLSHSHIKPDRGSFEKHGRLINLSVPSEGLFDVLIYDRMNTPRIDLMLAAIREPQIRRISEPFQEIETLLKDWNEDYQGWPIHEFRRSYLLSLMLDISPATRHTPSTLQSRGTSHPDVTCEPQFNPKPGVFKTDTEVTLRCNTAGAAVHYTVDGSQPLDGAPIYSAPIMVKGTALTIKAFASATGKRDSPVVTGIFRIGE